MPPTTSPTLLLNQVGEQWGLTISTSIISLTVPPGAAYAFIQVETNSIRLSERPAATLTTSSGPLVSSPSGFESYTPSLVRLIRNGSSDAIVNVTYYN